jgi:two-component system sensor histidine kinase UhpB
VGQSLTLLISGLRSAKVCRVSEACTGRVNEFQRLAEDALTEVRRLSLGLRPSLLDDLGLAPALERLVEDVRMHYPMQLSIEMSGIIEQKLPDDIATAIFRIVQEALSNIMKHSGAQQATIRIRRDHDRVLAEISDNGCGISPAVVKSPPAGHLGLRGMRERASLLGGRFELDTAPARGTRITVAIPVEGAAHG